ncbi:DUF1996 domain-containing protein [Dyella tabacisoli]|uniref:DUF1996 domain-containing protein n=1 Tax=Dyella tabacisoli TaxID=2282381 RepID=A0A369UTT9_9GAMM|nr:DUF1996 domain-containing protein [Dyella tabacisoli]
MMMFGRPGEAMVHDFFGNVHADAFSTADTLLAKPQTTCTSKSDGSSYWAPQMRHANTGEIIKPFMMKTYYRNETTDYPVVPFPKGLQLLVGDHHSTQAKRGVLYFCKNNADGGSYYTDVPASCPLFDGEKAQFNLSFEFPNCWDGVNFKPVVGGGHHSRRNATYDVNGVCPANYPIKIPQLQLNIGYYLPGNGDLSDLQLSMNPQMARGVGLPMWGNLYTAHADFFNAWRTDAMDFAVKFCLNRGVPCDKEIPAVHAEAIENAQVIGGEFADTNYAGAKQMVTQTNNTHQPKIGYMKFRLPDDDTLLNAPYDDVVLRFWGKNTGGHKNHMAYIYAVQPNWNEKTLTYNNAPACGGKYVARTWIGYSDQAVYRSSDSVMEVVKDALAKGQKEVAFCVISEDVETSLGTREGGSPGMLFFK